MKKLILTLVCIVALAGSAFAAVSPGHLPPAGDSRPSLGHTDGNDGGYDGSQGDQSEDMHHHGNNGNGGPVNPVPEPGTMALASMGLIALGAAARRRRGN